jgi:nicotinamidase-related amidase
MIQAAAAQFRQDPMPNQEKWMDALVVIDVQQGMFADPESPPHDGAAVVERIRALIAEARRQGKPVFFVQHDGGAGDVLAHDAPGFVYHPALAPQPGDRVSVKRHCNAFQETDLDAQLEAAGVRHLTVCGMQSEYCVDTTVRAAFERGYKITLVSDAHTTFDNPGLTAADIIAHHNRTLQGSFATLVPAAAVRFGG